MEIVNRELLLPEIKQACTFSAPVAPEVMRGVTHYSTFIDDLWSSPELTAILSACAGIALKPHPMQLERAHVNVQSPKVDAETPVFGWHTDSQPLVCIVMLSDVPDDPA